MSQPRQTPKASSLLRFLAWLARFTLKSALLLIVLVTLVIGGATAAFFAKREIIVRAPEMRWLVERFAPKTVGVEFGEFAVRISRPEDFFFVKRVSVVAQNLCVHYADGATDACFGEVDLAATGGFAHGWRPELLSIEPVVITRGQVAVDLEKMPSAEPAKKSSFDLEAFLRTEIFPKWQIDGSRIELGSLVFKETNKDQYFARLDLSTGEHEAILDLHEAQAIHGPLRARARIRLLRPGSKNLITNVKSTLAWKLFAEGSLKLDAKKAIDLKADADILSLAKDHPLIDFRAQTFWHGITGLKELRLQAKLDRADLAGVFSLKMGAASSQVKTLDFVNCGVSANLDQKIGGIKCGPETVRLRLAQQANMNAKPELYVLRPEFSLDVHDLEFGSTKKAEFHFQVALQHLGMLKLATEINGTVVAEPKRPLHYSLNGELQAAIGKFQKVVRLLNATPYSIPAPLNDLDGRISLSARLALSEAGGDVSYRLGTVLDSASQAMHLRLDGKTRLAEVDRHVEPSTDATLLIDSLKISAPRFDLRRPPRFTPDRRFGPLPVAGAATATATATATGRKPSTTLSRRAEAELATGEDSPAAKPSPMDFRLHVVTTVPQALQITNNFTKSPVPIDVDVVYAETRAKHLDSAQGKNDDSRGIASAVGSGTASASQTADLARREGVGSSSPISGTILIGRTPVEIFRRNAVIERIKLELLPSGADRIDGDVSVTYLDYNIHVLLGGLAANPQVHFNSDPPLEDNQVLAVLLFGRPLNELGDDQKASVGNLNAAFADAALGISSLYLLASTPIQSIGYDPERDLVTAQVGLGAGASLELGGGSDSSAIGFKKRLSHNFTFRSDVETLGSSGKRTVLALVEWIKRF